MDDALAVLGAQLAASTASAHAAHTRALAALQERGGAALRAQAADARTAHRLRAAEARWIAETGRAWAECAQAVEGSWRPASEIVSPNHQGCTMTCYMSGVGSKGCGCIGDIWHTWKFKKKKKKKKKNDLAWPRQLAPTLPKKKTKKK
jgi:hypothetical protein